VRRGYSSVGRMELAGKGRERELNKETDSSVGAPRRRALRAEMKAKHVC
jgi:hypothetical protein